MDKWYKLDNAARLYPHVANSNRTSVFRVSCVLHRTVNPVLLQEALDSIRKKYEFFFVRIHRGFFWNYFDINPKKLLVESESETPCQDINKMKNAGFSLRVLYYNKRISVEIFHALSDGGGIIEFLKSLVYYYLELEGFPIPNDGSIISKEGLPELDASDDSFFRYYDDLKGLSKKERLIEKQKKAYKLQGSVFPSGGIQVTSLLLSSKALHSLAKKHNTTITGYLLALLFHALFETEVKYKRTKKPVSIAVPVNLRRAFPSKTLRNFFSVINIVLPYTADDGLQELCQKVDEVLKEKTQKQYLQKQVRRTTRFSMTRWMRFAPLIIKKIFIQAGFSLMSETKRTLTLSNLGIVSIPEQMLQHISHMEVVSHLTPRCPISCSMVSTGDTTCISFSKSISDMELVHFFTNYLSKKEGLDITVYANEWGNYEM